MDSNLEHCILSEVTHVDHCSSAELVLEDISIPNIFSPNGDGINDDWSVELYRNSQIISCAIYDRWGNLLYRSDSGEVPIWNGRLNGKLLNPGVYVYKINYSDSTGEIIIKYGDITIMH